MPEESLESRSLRQFDALVSRGELLWQETTPQLIPSSPFNVRPTPSHSSQHLWPSLFLPPIPRSRSSLPAVPIPLRLRPKTKTHPLRLRSKTLKTKQSLRGPRPGFQTRENRGETQFYINKYSVVRPQFLLHTNDFVPQTDHLDEGDLGAAWEVLTELNAGSGKYVVIYNCGFEAGSSLGHKHLQILPLPPPSSFKLFPDSHVILEDSCTVPGIPFVHAVKKLPPSVSRKDLIEIYGELLERGKVEDAKGHNVLMTGEWMLVIPRRKGRKGILSANAAAMCGMVWVINEEEVRGWKEEGLVKLVCEFGVTVGRGMVNGY